MSKRTTENHRVKHNLRRWARRNFIDVLYAEQHSLCWYCKSACAIVAHIPEENRISCNHNFVTWKDGDDTFRAKIATIDHLDPLGDNGTNDRSNLVMACYDCNKDRTATTRLIRVCRECGGVLNRVGRKTKHCHPCSIKLTIQWLNDYGWKEVPNPDGVNEHTKFRDPATGKDHILRHACEILKERLNA